MRLIDIYTLEFKWFPEIDLPKYVILSHTWGDDEVNYQDMCWLQRMHKIPDDIKNNPAYSILLNNSFPGAVPASEHQLKARMGFRKIVETAEIADRQLCQYIWVDTCCIDKSSSAELQEAINSMYRWYQQAALCVVYLNDADPWTSFEDALKSSRWVTRGWTLQELIAPHIILFCDRDWTCIAQKRGVDHLRAIYRATGIPVHVLQNGDLSHTSIAQRMSWAAKRSTTRVEDAAYSLMGLFGIHMPMLYGEGLKAFIRLQEEIMRISNDQSLFAWRDPEANASTFRGLLARSPREFEHCKSIIVSRAAAQYPSTVTNIGLHVQFYLRKHIRDDQFVAILREVTDKTKSVAILLRRVADDQYVRVNPSILIVDNTDSIDELYGTYYRQTPLYVQQVPLIAPDFVFEDVFAFSLRIEDGIDSCFLPVIGTAYPARAWNPINHTLRIPNDVDDFVGAVWFMNPEIASYVVFRLLLGFSRLTCRPWCKILTSETIQCPVEDSDHSEWASLINSRVSSEERGWNDGGYVGKLVKYNHVFVHVILRSGLLRDNLSFMAKIRCACFTDKKQGLEWLSMCRRLHQ